MNSNFETPQEIDQALQNESNQFLRHYAHDIYRKTDLRFVPIFFLEWLLCIAVALWISPQTWIGARGMVHIHVWTALLGVPVLISYPLYLSLKKPGRWATRHANAIAQMLISSLLIHLTGGRVETHFHIFGSLALLASYRDIPVMLTATAVVAIDHFFRGVYFPESVFGVLVSSNWRWIEHSVWVLFEDAFLIRSIVIAQREMADIAFKHSTLSSYSGRVEAQVREQTQSLQALNKQLKFTARIPADNTNPIICCAFDGQILFYNPAAQCFITQESASVTLGVPELQEALTRCQQDPSPFNIRFLFQGRYYYFEFQTLSQEGWSTMYGKDITEIVELEMSKEAMQRQLMQSQKSELIGTLAGGIAHDFNNILGGILGYASMLKEELRDQPKLKRKIETIESSAIRGSELTRQILGFARKNLSEKSAFDVKAVIEEVVTMLARTIPKNITLTLTADSNLWPILGESSQLFQVIMNLCVNARDAMPQGGTITLHASNLNVDETFCRLHPVLSPGPHLNLTVTDNGTGIPPEIQSKIFDPFFTTKDIGKGTGLGLANVQSVVAQHLGLVTLYSEVNRGTSFKIYLPAAVPEAKQPADLVPSLAQPEDSKAGTLSSLRFLVTDDEAPMRALLQDILEDLGAQVDSAGDGEAAVSAAEAQNYDCILIDIMMPKLNGVEACQIIRKAKPTQPIILMSGFAAQSVINQIESLPNAGFIQKPFTQQQLLKALFELLEK